MEGKSETKFDSSLHKIERILYIMSSKSKVFNANDIILAGGDFKELHNEMLSSIVGQTRLFNFGKATSLEKKLNSDQLNSTKVLTLRHMLLVTESWVNISLKIAYINITGQSSSI